MPAEPEAPGHGLVAADLFFGLVGVLLLIAALLSPHLAAALNATHAPGTQNLAALATAERRMILLADTSGLTVFAPGAAASHFPLDTLGDAAFPGVSEGNVPLVLVTHGGNETAFVLDPLLARAGIARIDLLRLPASCTGLAAAPGGYLCQR